jgi:hypothetical protein
MRLVLDTRLVEHAVSDVQKACPKRGNHLLVRHFSQ